MLHFSAWHSCVIKIQKYKISAIRTFKSFNKSEHSTFKHSHFIHRCNYVLWLPDVLCASVSTASFTQVALTASFVQVFITCLLTAIWKIPQFHNSSKLPILLKINFTLSGKHLEVCHKQKCCKQCTWEKKNHYFAFSMQ